MTVNELIEQLQNYPGDMRALTLGYEGGFDDISLNIDSIVFNTNDKDKWYYGPHEYAKFVEGSTGVDCLIVRRGK